MRGVDRRFYDPRIHNNREYEGPPAGTPRLHAADEMINDGKI